MLQMSDGALLGYWGGGVIALNTILGHPDANPS